MKAAFIGLGSMGRPQASLLAASDLDLAVYDAFPEALEPFKGRARIAASPAEAAQGAGIASVCVRDDKQVREVVFGENGLVQGLARGSILLVHSTVHIDGLHALQKDLRPHGVALVDAPVTRTRRTEDEPFVLTMLGGADEDAARARAAVEPFSTAVDHVGPLGSAMALKIANNMVTWVELVIGVQAVKLSGHYGVPYEKLRSTMKANGNLSPSMEAMLDGQHKLAPGVNAGYEALLASQAGIGEKDLALAIESGEAAGLDMSLAAQARGHVRPAMVRKA